MPLNALKLLIAAFPAGRSFHDYHGHLAILRTGIRALSPSMPQEPEDC
jgi:hypothetical protein